MNRSSTFVDLTELYHLFISGGSLQAGEGARGLFSLEDTVVPDRMCTGRQEHILTSRVSHFISPKTATLHAESQQQTPECNTVKVKTHCVTQKKQKLVQVRACCPGGDYQSAAGLCLCSL